MNRQRRDRRLPGSFVSSAEAIDPENNGEKVLSAFTDRETYQQMCSIFVQILKESGMEAAQLVSIQSKLFGLKNIGHQINLVGSYSDLDEESAAAPSTSALAASNPSALHLLVKNVEKTVFRQRDFQERKEYIERYLKHLLKALPRTAVDSNIASASRANRFRSQFPRPKPRTEPENSFQISVERLRQELVELTKPRATDFIQGFKLMKSCFGHGTMEEQLTFSQIFNVIYDRSGKLIVSADEEGLIKIWSSETGLLLTSLKGHASYMEELHITNSNKYLVSCGNDGIRIWSLADLSCLCVVYCDKSVITVTSFSSGEQIICFADAQQLYLLPQSRFSKKVQLTDLPHHVLPKSRPDNNLVCEIDISSQGYTVVGFESGQLIIFDKGLLRSEQDVKFVHSWEHSNKCVEIKWNTAGNMLVSCSLDGSCRVWEFSPEMFVEGNIRSNLQLKMPKNDKRRSKRKQILCNTVNWTCKQNYIITAFSECNRQSEDSRGQGDIVVLRSDTLQILHQVRSKLPYQLQSINVLQPHPLLQNIAMYCECSGRVVILDIIECTMLAVFHSRGFHLGHPNFSVEPVEGKWSPDGDTFVVSSEYGNIAIYGYAVKEFYSLCPTEQFYTSDNEVFIYDENRVPVTIDGGIDINSIDRGPLCNVSKVAYSFSYRNDYEDLRKKGALDLKIHPKSSTPEDCGEVSKGYLTIVREQLTENHAYEEVFKTSTLSVSSAELYEQYRNLHQHLREVMEIKVQEYNGLADMNKLTVEEHHEIEMPAHTHTPVPKFKRLHRGAESDQSEDYFERGAQQSLSEEVIVKRSRRERREARSREYEEESQQPGHMKKQRSIAAEIKELQDEYNQMQRRKLRRRIHRALSDQQDAQQHVQEQQQQHIPHDVVTKSDMCLRCEQDKPARFCTMCSRGYCGNCKEFRGKEYSGDFRCFWCIVIRNSLSEERQVMKEPYEYDTRHQSKYVPQLGDEVYFFFQGYEQLLMKYHECFNPKINQIVDNFKLIEFDDNKELRKNPLCTVKRIIYLYPLKSRERNQRHFQQRTRHNLLAALQLQAEKGYTFYVYYIVDGVDFLVRKQMLNYCHDNDFIRHLQINSLVNVASNQLQIIEKGPIDPTFPNSSWKYLLVRDVHERLRRNHRPDHRINVWCIDLLPSLPFQSIPQPIAKKILTNIQQLRHTKPHLFKYFYHDVDTKTYADYNKFVEVCVSVEKIEKRLKNRYYRNKDSLLRDVNMIVTNSEVYNGEDHEVTRDAVELRRELLKIIQTEGGVVYDGDNHKASRSRLRQREQRRRPDRTEVLPEEEEDSEEDDGDDYSSSAGRYRYDSSSGGNRYFRTDLISQDSLTSHRRVTRSRNNPNNNAVIPKPQRRLTRRTAHHD